MLFAMIVVVILGTIGVAIEMGTVRLTRDRMQSAADTTALEVLRDRDFDPDGFGAPEAHSRDHGRRERNRNLASWIFSEELLPSYPESTQGAGPYLDLQTTSPGPMNAGLLVKEVGHSTPSLRSNYSGSPGSGTPLNKRNGDIVSGTFTGFEPGGADGYDGNPIHRERTGYERIDFEMPELANAPVADSVLVRLRRTIPNGQAEPPGWNLDLDREPDVSSSGWRWPLVFGMGTSIKGEQPADVFSVRHHGLALRATSITQARPAVRIGKASPELGEAWRIGAGPMAIRLGYWNNDSAFLTDTEGEVSAVLRLRPNYEFEAIGADDQVFGYLYPKQAAQVGDAIVPDALQPDGSPDRNLLPEYWESQECYIPLYLFEVGPPPDSVRERYVCGFARVRIVEIPTPPGEDDGDGPFMRVTKLRNEMSPGTPWLAPRNASATFDGRQTSNVYPLTGTATWNDLIEKLYELPGAGEGAPSLRDSQVYAPALVR